MKSKLLIATIFFAGAVSFAFAQSGASKVTSRLNSLINLANGKSFGIDNQTILYVNGKKVANPDPADVKAGDVCSFKQGSRMSADEVDCKR